MLLLQPTVQFTIYENIQFTIYANIQFIHIHENDSKYYTNKLLT